ncbi:TMAO reductase system periplasmic protein TorT [Ensifer soli]|uniref:TMAO reductase system periplasmic protein TorT n=1 Tax=Ciceribacter sp. sgz301302 TaxID=3342379 RepID=UPI0035BAEDAA
MTSFKRILACALAATALSAGTAGAADWWPFKIAAAKDGDLNKVEQIEYTPLEKAEKPWNLCVLYPHLQDSYWVSVNYGLIEEAKRLGVKVSVFQAGGYTALPKQISQYDDCLASGADAILIGAISEAGVAAKITEGMGKGIVNIAVANPVLETPITARITPDFFQKGFQTGEYVKTYLGDKQGAAVGFPGPQGSGWAETYMSGFAESLKTGNIKLLAEQYGEASVPAQLRLVEDALQTYPDMNVIWGGAPTAEAAIGAVQDAGRDDVTIIASYENQTMLKSVSEGKVLAFATEYPVIMGRISVDLAVRALEKKPHEKILLVAPGIVTKDNIATFDTTQIFAPEGTSPEFSVK